MSGLAEYSANARSKTIGQNFRVRAWVNYDVGSSGSTCSIRASNNVSSVTRNGTGDTTVNFATPIPDNFAAGHAVYDGNSAGTRGGGTLMLDGATSTDSGASVGIKTFYMTGVFGGTASGAAVSNSSIVSMIFVA